MNLPEIQASLEVLLTLSNGATFKPRFLSQEKAGTSSQSKRTASLLNCWVHPFVWRLQTRKAVVWVETVKKHLQTQRPEFEPKNVMGGGL